MLKYVNVHNHFVRNAIEIQQSTKSNFCLFVFPDLSEEFKKVLMFLLSLLTDKNVSGYGRDAIIDIIIKFVPRKEGTGRALTFITNGGKYFLELNNVCGSRKISILRHNFSGYAL